MLDLTSINKIDTLIINLEEKIDMLEDLINLMRLNNILV
jgi:hypothetical protein